MKTKHKLYCLALHQRETVSNKMWKLALQVNTEISSLGVIIDLELSFTSYWKKITKTAFYLEKKSPHPCFYNK